LTDLAVERAFAAGCRVCYLGTTRSPTSVYLNCGFNWVSGGVMRRPAPDGDDYERSAFAPGQRALVRDASWGDLPGLACLAAQPSKLVMLDCPRGIASPTHAPLQRCVSNFPAIWYASAASDGAMYVLQSAAARHRVLGFGSLTRSAGRVAAHTAIVDVAVHDAYDDDEAAHLLRTLSTRARAIGCEALFAHVAASDERKMRWFDRAGFRPIARLPGQLRLTAGDVDVVVLRQAADHLPDEPRQHP
jgi:L-amino acid N-acyltransferase YncA